jgi:hypothetical protein
MKSNVTRKKDGLTRYCKTLRRGNSKKLKRKVCGKNTTKKKEEVTIKRRKKMYSKKKQKKEVL